MIREFLQSLRTPASKPARELGYLYESIAFQERYRRCSPSWRDHLQHCHRTIIEAVERSGASRALLVLGSGPLYELPITELKSRFDRILLVDLIHPLDVRERWGCRQDVLLIEQDLLGLADSLMNWRGVGTAPRPAPPDLRYLEPDFVLSANCLSQLALRPRERIAGRMSASALDRYCESLSIAHLEHVASFRTAHLIISDFETRVRAEDGGILERAAPYFDPGTLRMHREWTWAIAPRGEMHRRNSVEMSVGAFTLE